MSSSKDRFEKTFSRKKKEINNNNNSNKSNKKGNNNNDKNKNHKEQVLASLLKSPSNQTHKINGSKPTKNPTVKKTPSSMSNKKVVTDAKQIKKPQIEKKDENLNKEKKRKAENGDDVEGKKKNKITNEKKEKEKEKKTEEEEGFECAFPTARIARIVKSEGLDCKISAEAVFLINKAAENFIKLFSEDAYDCAVQDRKSFVAYKHLSSVVSKEKRFDFLSDFVPEKLAAEKALAERKPAETLQS